MKFKIAYKFFIVFSITFLLVVILMIAVIKFYIVRNFAVYANKSLLEKYNRVAVVLAGEYQTNKGWHKLKNNRERWDNILRSTIAPLNIDNSKNKNFIKTPVPPEIIKLKSRSLIVFGAGKEHIIGGTIKDPKGYTLKAIIVSGQTAGWLGLHKKEHLANPLAVDFLKYQLQGVYIIGGCILVLAALVTFLLSRHLLRPIKKLTAGTRALSSREFDIRIEVDSSDELGQLATDFNEMATTLKQFETMRHQWISDIAHELRTPLLIIYGEIEALIDGIREVNNEALNSLYSEARHLGKIVNDLHDLSQADTGALTMQKVPVQPTDVLKEVLGHFKPRFSEKHITIESSLENLSALTIIGDTNRLRQLFSNLLENSLRYTDASGTLQIGIEFIDPWVVIFFDDSSPGVPEDALHQLFDRLYRVDSSRNRNLGGSGLGLSICKSIVNAFKGDIKATKGELGGLRIEVKFKRLKNKEKTYE